MFKQLAALLADKSQLTIMITGKPEKMSVIVLPKSQGDAALNTPLQLTGSAAELDEKFVELLSQYGSSRKSLEEQLAATQAVLDAAKATSVKKSVGALAANSAETSPTTGGESNEDDDEGSPGDSTAASATVAAPSTNLFAL